MIFTSFIRWAVKLCVACFRACTEAVVGSKSVSFVLAGFKARTEVLREPHYCTIDKYSGG